MSEGMPALPNVELLTTTSPVEVVLPRAFRDSLIREVQASRDGLETGGCLFGKPLHAEQTLSLVVQSCNGPGPNAVRANTHFDPDPQHDISEALAVMRAEPGVAPIGHWHTHPFPPERPPTGDLLRAWLQPQPPDLQVWGDRAARLRAGTGSPYWVGIIGGPDRRGNWTDPRFTIWVLRGSDTDPLKFRCEAVNRVRRPGPNGLGRAS